MEAEKTIETNNTSVYWITDELLYVKAGDVEKNRITVSETIKLFGDNKIVMDKLRTLLEFKNNMYPQVNFHKHVIPIQSSEKDINIEKIRKEIDTKLDEIINELGLEKSNDVMKQLKYCCLVQKYIVEHNHYDDKIMDEKEKYDPEDVALLDLYNAVVLNNSVCTSNSLMFKALLQKVGVNVKIVALISKGSNNLHAANLVELDGDYYFFDSTLEQSIYKMNCSKTDGKLVLCCAGLGINQYCPIYTPNVILPDNPMDDVLPLPDNISFGSIPQEIVNKCITEPEQVVEFRN